MPLKAASACHPPVTLNFEVGKREGNPRLSYWFRKPAGAAAIDQASGNVRMRCKTPKEKLKGDHIEIS